MNKNGFTLVELMVVIVIIGILAAVAIPRMTQATHRARANEGATVLAAIANMQHVKEVETGEFVLPLSAGHVSSAGTQTPAPTVADWANLGFTTPPRSQVFGFEVEQGTNQGGFIATATLATNLGVAVTNDELTVNARDQRTATGGLATILTNWSNTATTP